jgi:hypothetical protein
MESNKLRIGNYYLAFGVDLKQVETLTKDKILIDFTPILLTEEWHNKFGTSKNVIESFEYVLPRKNNMYLKVIFTGDYVMLRQGQGTLEDDIVSIWNKDLTKRGMYVHEWQNLYFALTGEELTITK